MLWAQGETLSWPYHTDLARIWWEWQRRPFVFARWVVRRRAPERVKRTLEGRLRTSLMLGMASRQRLAGEASRRLGIAPSVLVRYLEGFHFELGESDLAGLARFHAFLEKSASQDAMR